MTNTLVTTITVSLLLVLFAWLAGRNLKLIPGKFQSVVELLVMYPYEFTRDTLQNDAVTKRIFPVIMTIFLLVLLQNWFGLLPITEGVGIAPATPGGEVTSYFYSGATDLNFTFSLALIAFLAIEFFGVTTMGFFTYAKKFLNFQSPIKFVVGLIELVSEFARLISYSFRLFGNVFAGKVLILVIGFFVPLFLPVPFLAFETFVGFIQAAIFALLTLFFTKIAIEIHDEAHSEEHASLAMSEALEEGLHHAEA